MHLNLSLTYSFILFNCLLNILFETFVSSQILLPEEYINSAGIMNYDGDDDQQSFSFPGQRPGQKDEGESQRKEYLKQVEGHLLQRFGLTSRPKPANQMNTSNIHPYLVNLFSTIQSSNSINNDQSNNKVKRSRRKVRSIERRIAIKGSHNTIRSHDLIRPGHSDSRVLQFDVYVPLEEELKGAELRLPYEQLLNSVIMSNNITNNSIKTKNNNYGDQDENSIPNSVSVDKSSLIKSQNKGMMKERKRIELYEILSNPTNKDLGQFISRIIDVQVIGDSAKEWLSFDVLPAVKRWIKDPTTNFGLYVSISHLNGTRISGGTFVQDNVNHHNPGPILVTYSNDLKGQEQERVARTKRAPGGGGGHRKHRRKGRRDHCRRHSLWVDFSDVGWTDWIVAPAGYQAYFCQGECPYPLDDHFNATNHAIVQNLINSVSPTMVPKACCIPTELSAISMLYVDENDKVVLKSYQDMVVEGCGCR